MTAPDNLCDGPGCNAPVKSRRKSQSGRHYCKRPECQAAKQAFYRERDGKTKRTVQGDARVAELEGLVEKMTGAWRTTAVMLQAARLSPRVTCDDCGRADALKDFPHPPAGTSEHAAPDTWETCNGTNPFTAAVPKPIQIQVWPK